MLPPAKPASRASMIVSATCSGCAPYPSSRSPFTGTALAAVISLIRVNMSSRDTAGAPSGKV